MSMKRSVTKRALKFSRGMTLVELLIAMAIVVVLVAFAVQGFSGWVRNMSVRSTAESVLSGLQIARSEALKRNTTMHFQLVTTLTDSCALATAGPHWVVSQRGVAGGCAVEPANPSVQADPLPEGEEEEESTPTETTPSTDAGNPFIFQRYDGSNAFNGGVRIEAGHNDFTFNGLGNLATITEPEYIDIGVKDGDTWKSYLRIHVLPGGGARMCNPGSNFETQKCD